MHVTCKKNIIIIKGKLGKKNKCLQNRSTVIYSVILSLLLPKLLCLEYTFFEMLLPIAQGEFYKKLGL